MSELLEIHPASESERVQIYRNNYEMWGGKGLSLEEHIEWGLNLPRHDRGEFVAGHCEGKLVASLVVFRLKFLLRGKVVPGMGIGGVFTVSAYRQRGFAAQMLRWAEEREHASGSAISLLFSDIDPTYYARLGYVTCASWKGWVDPSKTVIEAEGNVGTLIPFSPQNEIDSLQDLYDVHHATRPISIARDRDYWEYLLRNEPADSFYWLETANGARLGYVRLNERDDKCIIRDWALLEETEDTEQLLFRTLLQTARQRCAAQVGGWLPDSPTVRTLFGLKRRDKEITMLKPLDPTISLQADLLREAQHFKEIDHF